MAGTGAAVVVVAIVVVVPTVVVPTVVVPTVVVTMLEVVLGGGSAPDVVVTGMVVCSTAPVSESPQADPSTSRSRSRSRTREHGRPESRIDDL